jgi:hypothetical protein
MSSAIRALVQEFGWIHTALGLFGNVNFLAGSVLFLPAFQHLKTFGVWLFIVGAAFMLLGALGNLLVKVYEAQAEHPHHRDTTTHTQEGGRRESRQAA